MLAELLAPLRQYQQLKAVWCCGRWIRTTDLLVMSQASYHCYHPTILSWSSWIRTNEVSEETQQART